MVIKRRIVPLIEAIEEANFNAPSILFKELIQQQTNTLKGNFCRFPVISVAGLM